MLRHKGSKPLKSNMGRIHSRSTEDLELSTAESTHTDSESPMRAQQAHPGSSQSLENDVDDDNFSFPILSKQTQLSHGNDNRSVRFSKKESLMRIYDDASDLPFDEKVDVATGTCYSIP